MRALGGPCHATQSSRRQRRKQKRPHGPIEVSPPAPSLEPGSAGTDDVFPGDWVEPGFWPIDEKWWLFGGWPTGITLIISAFIALALIIFSYQKFHGVDDPIAAAEEAARDKG